MPNKGSKTNTEISLQEFISAINFSYDGVWITDGEGKTLFVNNSIPRITRLEKQLVEGKNMQDLVEQGVFDKSATLIAIEKKEVVTIIQKVHTGVITMVTASPIFGNDGKIQKVITNVRDITELNKLKDKIEFLEATQAAYEKELKELKMKLFRSDGIIAASHRMQDVIQTSTRLSKYDSPITISGEKGSGKEMIARLIHENSERSQRPFIKINCTLPAELLIMELFGHHTHGEHGQSISNNASLIEASQGGVLYVENADQLPKPLQSEIIETIERLNKKPSPNNLGNADSIRIISSTAQKTDGDSSINSKHPLLSYSVFTIEIPPLKERPEDIPLLTKHFLDRLINKYGKELRIPSSTIYDFLQRPWKGNVKELKNTIERLYILADDGWLSDNLTHKADALKTQRNTKNTTLQSMLYEHEKSIIEKAFSRYKTSQLVAKALGISQASAVRKAQKFSVPLKKRGRPKRG
ncbi:sigma 54-interacting transcriptional regulator [Vreelandella nigrificans]|uniref:Transcriptional regulatory protein TyrR n=1 Tax=Vreelandella nigrificans TaxID=2042704 RepID=A0A2A4HFF0_9GAMM|nr:sigma 54-interacting transcriptional regulator [Halomonas nigrificans]PCF93718.1 hypothetical protein CPA45_21110 [Halomonas nigrificans]